MWTFIIAVAVIFGIIIGALAGRRADDRLEWWLAFVIIGGLAASVAFTTLAAIYGYFAFVFATLL